jgi:hypothetical protein
MVSGQAGNGFARPSSLRRCVIQPVTARRPGLASLRALPLAVAWSRFRWILPVLSVAGVLICAGQVVRWSLMGAWPFHDTVAYWLAGRHVLEGAPVYTTGGPFLAFLYGPPWAILWAPISLLPVDLVVAGLLVLQVLALRYIVGSWLAVGLVAWLPFVPRELATGNIDFLMAAAILAGIHGSSWPVSLFAFAKISPALVMFRANRRQWIEAFVVGIILIAITLPWWHLWYDWAFLLLSNPQGGDSVVPLIVRLPVVVALVALRRRWALAAGAALLTPAFHAHSVVLLLPAAILLIESIRSGTRAEAKAERGSQAPLHRPASLSADPAG